MSERGTVDQREAAGTSLVDEWLSTRVLEHVRELQKESPEVATRVLRMVDTRLQHLRKVELGDCEHRRRLEWAWFGFRVFMAVLGFGALIIYALVAAEFIQSGNAVQASIALGAGGASVVTIFVTGRAAAPLFRRQERGQTRGQ